jgi:hypothetical protein
LLEILSIFTWQVCPNPKDINVRIVGNEDIVPKTGGPQIYSKYDIVDGFECNDEDQIDGSCEDYEVQLCVLRINGLGFFCLFSVNGLG